MSFCFYDRLIRTFSEKDNFWHDYCMLCYVFGCRRQSRYQGTPRNILRHIVMSEIKAATAALPPVRSHALNPCHVTASSPVRLFILLKSSIGIYSELDIQSLRFKMPPFNSSLHFNTVVPFLVATLNRGHPLYLAHKSLSLLLSIHIHVLLPLTKGHLSNVATISLQIGWPY